MTWAYGRHPEGYQLVTQVQETYAGICVDLAKRVPMLYIPVPVHVEVETMSEAMCDPISSSAVVLRQSLGQPDDLPLTFWH